MFSLLQTRLSPFKHKNFRAFFLAQSLSLIGQWSHDLARAWIVLELLGRAGALGSLQLAMALPALFFMLQGGVLVDRMNVRQLMMATRAALAVAALILAAIVHWSEIQFWMLILFAIFEGLVISVDTPAYQALTVRLVPRQDFQQALALNSTNFHSARMLGPLVAGLLMAWQGPAAVFLLDGISYLGVVWVLKNMDLEGAQRSQPLKTSSFNAIQGGLRYIWQSPSILYKVLQLMLTISLLIPLVIVVFRTYMQQKFELSAEGFGYFFTVPALGSMIGALSFAAIKPQKPIKALIFGIPVASLCAALIPLCPTPELSSVVMAMMGFAMYLSLASLTVSLHLEVVEDFRGRLGSVVGIGFMSLGPLMGYPLGVLADEIGFAQTIWGTTGVFVICSAWLWSQNRAVFRGTLTNTHQHGSLAKQSQTQK